MSCRTFAVILRSRTSNIERRTSNVEWGLIRSSTLEVRCSTFLCTNPQRVPQSDVEIPMPPARGLGRARPAFRNSTFPTNPPYISGAPSRFREILIYLNQPQYISAPRHLKYLKILENSLYIS